MFTMLQKETTLKPFENNLKEYKELLTPYAYNFIKTQHYKSKKVVIKKDAAGLVSVCDSLSRT